MSDVTGVIEAMTGKDVKTKYGVKPVYSLKIADEWYGGLWKQPDCQKGDTVEFNTTSREHNGKTYYSVDGVVTVTSRGEGQASPSPISTSSSTTSTSSNPRYTRSGNKFPINPVEGQMSIIIQNCMNRATEIFIAQYNHLTAADRKKFTADAIFDEISYLGDKFIAKASGQDLMDEQIKTLGTKYEEYQKLLAGENLDESQD